MIIKELIKANICFVVIQYQSILKLNKWVQFKEWEIIALQEDKNKLYSLCKDGEQGIFNEKQGGYEKTSDQRNPQGIISRDMSFDEITEFKNLMHFFNIHNHKADGRLYELKKDSLKEKYQQING